MRFVVKRECQKEEDEDEEEKKECVDCNSSGLENFETR
jgi:hypothetical protein